MKIAIITDAWYPQINGVVRTLTKTVEGLKARGHDVIMVTPETFRTVPCPTYPEIRLSIFPGKRVSAQLRAFGPDCLHIATEGPLGLAARSFARRNQLAFTPARRLAPQLDAALPGHQRPLGLLWRWAPSPPCDCPRRGA